MKSLKILVLIITCSILFAGCSSQKKESGALPFQKDQEESETNTAAADFEEKFFTTIEESNEMLQTFNKSLDGLYTGQTSNEQFATVLTNIIGTSNELVTTVEEYEIDPSLIEFKQQLVMHLNIQHQMFLDAVDMAKNDEVHKDSLRETYLTIKQEQTTLVSTWNGY